MVSIAVGMGALAVLVSVIFGHPLVDPDGFIGPSYLRLPTILLLAFMLDLLPRTLWGARFHPKRMGAGLPRAGPHALDAAAARARGQRPALLLRHLRQLSEPQVAAAVRRGQAPQVRQRAQHHRQGAVLRPVARRGAPPCPRHRRLRRGAVDGLPVVPAAGPARPRGLADLVAQPRLRLLVRGLPVRGLDPRHDLLLRAAHAGPGHRLPVRLRRPPQHRGHAADDARSSGRGSTTSTTPAAPCSRSPVSPACTSPSRCWSP